GPAHAPARRASTGAAASITASRRRVDYRAGRPPTSRARTAVDHRVDRRHLGAAVLHHAAALLGATANADELAAAAPVDHRPARVGGAVRDHGARIARAGEYSTVQLR